jgi:hypothetical protein
MSVGAEDLPGDGIVSRNERPDDRRDHGCSVIGSDRERTEFNGSIGSGQLDIGAREIDSA